jgi:hypothetical protein
MGTLTDSFDSVIQRMIKREKNTVSGRSALEGTDQTAATTSSQGAVNEK